VDLRLSGVYPLEQTAKPSGQRHRNGERIPEFALRELVLSA
jgi:hypothetical protein